MTTNMAMVHNMWSYKATCDLDIPDHRYPFEHCDVLLKMPILLQKQNPSLGVCVCVCVCVLYLPRYSFGRGGWCYTLACLWRICGHVNQHLYMHHTTVSLPTSYVFLLKVCETPIWAAFKFASAIQCVPNHSCAHAIQLVWLWYKYPLVPVHHISMGWIRICRWWRRQRSASHDNEGQIHAHLHSLHLILFVCLSVCHVIDTSEFLTHSKNMNDHNLHWFTAGNDSTSPAHLGSGHEGHKGSNTQKEGI